MPPKSTCQITGCNRSFYARGWCERHYSGWKRNGDPTIMLTLQSLPIGERFAAYVAFGEGCWEWKGARDKDGYGVFSIGRKTIRPHRFFYEAVYGPIGSLQIDHVFCYNPPCCRPDHLEPVTLRENVLRGLGYGAMNATKTHCKHGHEFSPANTGLRPKGRYCIECGRLRMARIRASRR